MSSNRTVVSSMWVNFPQSAVAERGPTILRIVLGGQLRRMREERGLSREAAGEAIRASGAKISRLELGRTGFKERDIRDLLALYGISDAEVQAAYVNRAYQANRPGWWQRYADLLPSWFETYIGLEQAADVIRTYETQLVPGLLQTPDYARAVVSLAYGDEGNDVQQRVTMRTCRQQILRRDDGPALWAVIDEAALRRPMGGIEVMRSQIDALVSATRLPNVTIQILPYSAGGPAASGGAFSILRFPEPSLPDIVYIEQLTSALYLEKRSDVQQYLAVMDKLGAQAEAPDRTADLLIAMRP